MTRTQLRRASAATTTATATQPQIRTLPNGLRAVVLPMPWRSTASLSVFIRTGSLHEPRRLNGISHVVEHMAFKGTATRNCQRINLDAESLGAEVNAHTDKDHTAFHIDGLARDLPAFVAQLADIVLASEFPEDQLALEREVILQEFAEVEEDPAAVAFQLLDRASYGLHAAAQPVIGRRASVERITRADLLQYVQTQYTAANTVVAVAGPVDAPVFFAAVERAFGTMPPGAPHVVHEPIWLGGQRSRRMPGSAQCHLALAWAAPPLADEAHAAHVLAAAVLGEGMSSPLLDRVREQLGLAYYVNCSADVLPHAGQFVIEAATAPRHAAELLTEIDRLLARHARRVTEEALERAQQQMAVRLLRALESPGRSLEAAAQDLFTFGRVRDPRRTLAQLRGVDEAAVQAVFKRLRRQCAAVALVGSVPAAARAQAEALFGAGR